MPVLVKGVKIDSFLVPMTAGSGNLDFLWSQPLLHISPVLLVPQSCLEVQWLGRNRCPISWCYLNFMSFDSTSCQKELKKMPYRQPGQRKVLNNQFFFAKLENAIFHTSAQFSPNFRKGRALKICWWFRTYFWATLMSPYNDPITNGSIRNTIWVVFFANLDALRYSKMRSYFVIFNLFRNYFFGWPIKVPLQYAYLVLK